MSENRTVSVGIVGPGFWTETMYMPALNKHPNAVITAVCGRNPERTKAFAEQNDIPHYFTDYDEMVNSGLIDAVVISTINKTHYWMTMKALELRTRLHVYVKA